MYSSLPIINLPAFNSWGPLTQSEEPWNLDHWVPGSSLGWGGGLCPWARHFIYNAQTAEIRGSWPMWR